MVKIEIAKKDISQVKSIIHETLEQAKAHLRTFVKGKDGKLYHKSVCKECYKQKLIGSVLDYKYAKRNQQEYIKMLELFLNRLKAVKNLPKFKL